ncbi:MAG: helix-turn-helix domain-containing protein [Halobacteria archaeon]
MPEALLLAVRRRVEAQKALQQSDFSQLKAAKKLKISPRSIRYYIKKYNIKLCS